MEITPTTRHLPVHFLLLVLTCLTSVGSPPSHAAQSEKPRGGDELPVALLLAAVRGEPGTSHLHAWLEVPGSDLGSAPDPLVFHLRALNSVGAVEGSFEQPVKLDGESARYAAESGLKVHGQFPVTPGAYTLELRITAGDRKLAERTFPFALAPWEPEQAAVLPPFFIDDLEEHVVVREASGDAVDPFVTGGGEGFVPVVVPVLERGTSRARVTLVGYHLAAEKNLLEARLFTADGSLLGKDRLGLVAQSDTAPDGLDRMDFSLGTEGLAPGEYQLEVSIQDLEHGRTDQALMPFRIE